MPQTTPNQGLDNYNVDSVDRYEEEYPEELSDRLQWLESHLEIPHDRFLVLMGLRNGEGLDWATIAARDELRAERVEHVLSKFLSYFRYDPAELLRFIDRLPDRVRAGELTLDELIPSYRANASPAELDETLIGAILQDRGELLTAMAVFLSRIPNQLAGR